MNGFEFRDQPANIVIVGASGDLSRRKLVPALFSLYCNGFLPKQFNLIGFARTPMDDVRYRELMMSSLTCRYVPEANRCDQLMDDFLARCFYHCGNYGDPASFKALHDRLSAQFPEKANNLFYMAIPPSMFSETASSIQQSGLVHDPSSGYWSRVVLEKPFGRDSASFQELHAALSSIFQEKQTYRIDHYLGKEVIQNLMVLRFANKIFEPIWNRNYIDSVSISWGETLGVEGRAGYFDHYGIIRDVVQNHLIQILALVAMEQPIHNDAEAIRDEKVKLLRCVAPVALDDLVVGQYTAAKFKGQDMPGYMDDPEVPRESLTPTYARCKLHLNNPRWHGVPFLLTAGKALDASMTQIRIKFKPVPYSIFADSTGMAANELVIRVQPNEAIELHVVNKRPGLGMSLERTTLDMLYHRAFSELIPDAYERLLLDVMRGDRSLFLRADELAVSWDIVTSALLALEDQKVHPLPYAFGSKGPQVE